MRRILRQYEIIQKDIVDEKEVLNEELEKSAIVEELGDEGITKKGEFDEKTEQITLVTKMLVSTAGPGVGESEELGDEE